jgi:hypothetical protein
LRAEGLGRSEIGAGARRTKHRCRRCIMRILRVAGTATPAETKADQWKTAVWPFCSSNNYKCGTTKPPFASRRTALSRDPS